MIGKSVGFADGVKDLLGRIEYKAVSGNDLDAVLRLRYEAYAKEGAIEPCEDRRFLDDYDGLQNSANIGVYFEGELAGAIRIHVISSLEDKSPTGDVFRDCIEQYLAAGERIVDANRFVVDYALARRLRYLANVLTRVTMMAGGWCGARYSIFAVRPEHQAFYSKTFFAERVAMARSYPGLTKDFGLMVGDFQRDLDKIVARNPFYESSAAEQDRLFGKINLGGRMSVAAE
ncbi:MAG: hypothetical protein EPN75_08740 [Beijerinckiaceae bacterium]|nr:MAG: hypothetical protein EPN75_08740 [Beijerinckiaceae bacterium]